MFHIRRVPDDITPANHSVVQEAQRILREQFPGMDEADIDKLPDQLRDPYRHRFVSRLYVAEGARDRMLGVALLLHEPQLNFCYLELISAAPGRTGRGVGASMYSRLREVAHSLGAHGIYLECLPDDPTLSPDAKVRAQNEARLRFYERFGARPLANTKYETPLKPDDTDPPYLVFDPLGATELPAPKTLRKVVKEILERKYGHLCTPEYIKMVTGSIKDNVALREPRYVSQSKQAVAPVVDKQVALVVNDKHSLHHVHERGYVEAPVRIKAILEELNKSGLFERLPARSHPDRFIREVHDSRLVNYLRRASKTAGKKKSIYPYVFPIRNTSRPPRDETVLAGYYCIDTFTPLNQSAYLAARQAVDCALTAAAEVLDGRPLAYALVRPPGHHAERASFGGFCYFNNSAIAANYLSRYGKVAILDIDYHHGNGQQDIFYDRADVLTVSVHGHPRFAYPYFSGFADETGRGVGAGYNLNIPLSEHTSPEEYLAGVDRALRRISQFAPDYLVVALGLDTARGDPTGTWNNRIKDFLELGKRVGAAEAPILVVQEGGYLARSLGKNVYAFFRGLAAATEKQLPRKRGNRTAKPAKRRWRTAVRHRDIEGVRALVASAGVFSTEEQGVAAELTATAVQTGADAGYRFVFAETGGRLDAYACYGPVPGAPGRFDLYWIAVSPDCRRQGLGREVLERAERAAVKDGATRMYLDTAGREAYRPTHAFYKRCGYKKVAELQDYYADGDSKIIFMKELGA